VIQEFDLSVEKIRKDFSDVHLKYTNILQEAHRSKQLFEGFEKRLSDLCNR
jgi:DNA-binding SARP family transcriptional activator